MKASEISSLVFLANNPNASIDTVKQMYQKLESKDAISSARALLERNSKWRNILLTEDIHEPKEMSMSIMSEAKTLFAENRRQALEAARKRVEERIPKAKQHLRELIREEILEYATRGNESFEYIIDLETFPYQDLGKQTIKDLMQQIFQEEEIVFVEEDPEKSWYSAHSTCCYTLSGWGNNGISETPICMFSYVY